MNTTPLFIVLPRSRSWICPVCEKTNVELLPDPEDSPKHVQDLPSDTSCPRPTENSNSPVSNTPSISSDTVDAPNIKSHENPSAQAQPTLTSSSTFPTRPNETPAPSPVSAPTTRLRSSAPLSHRGNLKPPAILDATICVLLVVVFAILCRRLV